MAKIDFCFTYYDGDAARDMAHMNRLERGGYTDIIISQRKFGRLTIEQIKKILGRDFEEIWPSIELVMVEEEGKFFIEWVENSLIKMRLESKCNSENGSKGGRPRKNPIESETKPKQNRSKSEKKPIEDGNEYEIEDEIESFGKSENLLPKIRDGEHVILPFESEAFTNSWDLWKKYRLSEHRFRYKSPMTEQAALKRLSDISDHSEKEAIEIIKYSISQGYKGLYKENRLSLNENFTKNGTSNRNRQADFRTSEPAKTGFGEL